jgi:alpha-pyrone synthase
MSVYIHHIATAVPSNIYEQQYLMNFMKKHVAKDRMTSMILHRIYTQSGISTRYSVLKVFGSTELPNMFVDEETLGLRMPTTGERNKMYIEEGRKLFIEASEKLFTERPDIPVDSVTHVITVSCTGFYAPGPDMDIVHALGLPKSTQRLHVGFMGCYASLPAMRTAKSIIDANPDAVVLLVSAELCSLHLKFDDDTNSLLSTTVFADGCAAALLSSKPDFNHDATGRSAVGDVSDLHHEALIEIQDQGEVVPTSTRGIVSPDTSAGTGDVAGSTGAFVSEVKPSKLRLDDLFTAITPNGAEDMAWSIGDYGFDMVLTSYIPDLISSNLEGVLKPIWDQSGLRPEDINLWAVHPGGRAIVDKVQQQLQLADSQLESSRTILRDYGNMSSATILFVLKHLMETTKSEEALQVLAMAFGPGITVETALLTYMP